MNSDQEPKILVSEKVKGVIAMFIAMFAFTTVSALLKTTEHSYHASQIVFFRFFFALIPYGIVLFLTKETASLKIKNKREPLFQGAIWVVCLGCLFESIKLLTLADATTLTYATSLFVVLLAIPLLGEQIDRLRWAAVLIGFCGVLIVSQPNGDLSNLGAIYGIISAFLQAFLMVHIRQLSFKNSNSAILLYSTFSAILLSGLTLPFVWVTPSGYDLFVLITVGIGGGTGQYLITVAYRHAPAGLLSPIIYSSLIWGVLYGIVFFGEIPTPPLYIGAPLIIIAGLIVVLQKDDVKIKQTKLKQTN